MEYSSDDGSEDSGYRERKLRVVKIQQMKDSLKSEFEWLHRTDNLIKEEEDDPFFIKQCLSLEELCNELVSRNHEKQQREENFERKLHKLRLLNSLYESDQLGKLNYEINLNDANNYLVDRDEEAAKEFSYYFPLRNEKNGGFLAKHIDFLDSKYNEADFTIREELHNNEILKEKVTLMTKDITILQLRVQESKSILVEIVKGFRKIKRIKQANEASGVDMKSKEAVMQSIADDTHRHFNIMLSQLKLNKAKKSKEAEATEETIANMLVDIEELYGILKDKKQLLQNKSIQSSELEKNMDHFELLIPKIETLKNLETYIKERQRLKDEEKGKFMRKLTFDDTSSLNISGSQLNPVSKTPRNRKFSTAAGMKKHYNLLSIKPTRDSIKKKHTFVEDPVSKISPIQILTEFFANHALGTGKIVSSAIQLFNEEEIKSRQLQVKFFQSLETLDKRKSQFSEIRQELDLYEIADQDLQILKKKGSMFELEDYTAIDSGLFFTEVGGQRKLTTINTSIGNQLSKNWLYEEDILKMNRIVAKTIFRNMESLNKLTRYLTVIQQICNDNNYAILEIKDVMYLNKRLTHSVYKDMKSSYYCKMTIPIVLRKYLQRRGKSSLDVLIMNTTIEEFREVIQLISPKTTPEIADEVFNFLQTNTFAMMHFNLLRLAYFWSMNESKWQGNETSIQFFRELIKEEKKLLEIFLIRPMDEFMEAMLYMLRRIDEGTSGPTHHLYEKSKRSNLMNIVEEYRKAMTKKHDTIVVYHNRKEARQNEINGNLDSFIIRKTALDEDNGSVIDFSKVNIQSVDKKFIEEMISKKETKKKSNLLPKYVKKKSKKEAGKIGGMIFGTVLKTESISSTFNKKHRIDDENESENNISRTRVSDSLVSTIDLKSIMKDCITLEKISCMNHLSTKRSKGIVNLMTDLKSKRTVNRSGICPTQKNRIPKSSLEVFSDQATKIRNKDESTQIAAETNRSKYSSIIKGRSVDRKNNMSLNFPLVQKTRINMSTERSVSRIGNTAYSSKSQNLNHFPTKPSQGFVSGYASNRGYLPVNPTFRTLANDPFFRTQDNFKPKM